MKSMKDNGYYEVKAALFRIRRLHALGRVGTEDCDYIASRLEEVETRICNMEEYDANGDPIVAG